jgi:RNA-directed DNA polymerase
VLNESDFSFAGAMNPPPLLVSFSDLEQYLGALPRELNEQFGSEIRRLVEVRLPPVVSRRCLAILFGFSGKFVGAMARGSPRYYRHFVVPKGRGKRHIQAPRVALKVIQKWLGYHLASAIKYAPCVYGFVKGRSAVQAASIHCGAKWVFSTDIRDFFQTTKISVVRESLESIGYSPHGADLFAALCCYGQGLAQGSPASPVLSNLAFRSADVDLARIAKRPGVRYTRYADDIVFSGAGSFPEDLPSQVRQIIENHGWLVAEAKERISLFPSRLKVHGLMVQGPTPRLTKGYRNRIRAYRHLLVTNRVAPEDLRKVHGHLAYAASVEQL